MAVTCQHPLFYYKQLKAIALRYILNIVFRNLSLELHVQACLKSGFEFFIIRK